MKKISSQIILCHTVIIYAVIVFSNWLWQANRINLMINKHICTHFQFDIVLKFLKLLIFET
jgi:hypothetical protein